MKSKIFSGLLIISLLLQTACGYVLHPERRNQHTGNKIDVDIAALDAIGLLFFILPGLIAYAVDFSSKTIYLPRGASSSLDISNAVAVKFEGKLTKPKLEKILEEHLQQSIKLEETALLF